MSSTTPPGESRRPDTSWTPGTGQFARLPNPGNAELLVWIIALIVAAIVAAIADLVTSASWFDFFKWTTIAYILSRGIAKASRVLEH